jgi:ketosteroid isomerase-like protein
VKAMSRRGRISATMQARSFAAILAVALAPIHVAAAPQPPPQSILKLANAVIDAANTDNASAFAGLYTNEAVVVDENPPFLWRGAGAGTAWWHVVEAVAQKMKLTHLKAIKVRISEFKQSATDAYLIQPMTVSGIAGGKAFAEPGTMTYTFHNAAGKWLISSQVWTAKP